MNGQPTDQTNFITGDRLRPDNDQVRRSLRRTKRRDRRGRFGPGNRVAIGHGNPHTARVLEWRSVLAEMVTADDVREGQRQRC